MIGNVNVPGASAADLANKVDKIVGKGLSANDFTNDLLSKLNGLLDITSIGSGLSLLNGTLSSSSGNGPTFVPLNSSDMYTGYLNTYGGNSIGSTSNSDNWITKNGYFVGAGHSRSMNSRESWYLLISRSIVPVGSYVFLLKDVTAPSSSNMIQDISNISLIYADADSAFPNAAVLYSCSGTQQSSTAIGGMFVKVSS